MKHLKFTIAMALCIFALTGTAQSRLNFSSGQLTKTAQVIPTRSVEYASDGVIVTYTIPTADEIPASDGSNAIIWAIQGFTNNTGEGNPAVPMRNDIFSFEGSANISVELIEENHRDYMVNIAPFTDPEQKEGSGEMKPYEGFFPESPIFLRGKEEYRGNDISYVAVCPVQYDYENSIARAYTKLVYKISYAESPLKAPRRTPGDESGAQRQFSGVNTFANVAIPLVKSNEENPILKSSGSGNIPEIAEDYLIITSMVCRPAAEKLAQWKRILGYNVTVNARLTWREANIKSAIANFYSSSTNPTYVLLLGNATMIPPQKFASCDNGIEYATDYNYMCLGGEGDNLADLIFGRIPANDANDANIAIDKIIRYEQGIGLSKANMDKGVHLSYFEEDWIWKGEEKAQFIRTSEEIKEYLEDKENVTVDRLYVKDDNVVPIYYSASVNNIYRSANRELLPEELRSPDFVWHPQTGTTNSIVNLWGQMPLYVLYISHSVNDRWSFPYFEAKNISRLNDISNPPFLFSMSCQAGGFDKEICLAKEFICQKGAAVNVIASTSPGWCGYQDVLVESMFDAFFPAHKWKHSFELNAVPTTSDIDILDSYQNPSFKRFSVATILEHAKNYTTVWLVNDGGTFDDVSDPERDKYRKLMSDTRVSFENFGDPTLIMPNFKPSKFRVASVTRTDNSITISGVDFSKSKVSFYNPNTGQVINYFSFDSSPFVTDSPDDWIVCVKGNEMIPFVDFGENSVVDVEPVY